MSYYGYIVKVEAEVPDMEEAESLTENDSE